MRLFEWWGGLSPWIRYGVAVLFLLLSTLLWFADRFWPYGWVVGIILLLMAGPSRTEKKGYRY